jgi:hypothetical protein
LRALEAPTVADADEWWGEDCLMNACMSRTRSNCAACST